MKLSFGRAFAPLQAVSGTGLVDASRIIPSASGVAGKKNAFNLVSTHPCEEVDANVNTCKGVLILS